MDPGCCSHSKKICLWAISIEPLIQRRRLAGCNGICLILDWRNAWRYQPHQTKSRYTNSKQLRKRLEWASLGIVVKFSTERVVFHFLHVPRSEKNHSEVSKLFFRHKHIRNVFKPASYSLRYWKRESTNSSLKTSLEGKVYF